MTALLEAPAGAVPVGPRTGRRRGGGPLLVVAIALTALRPTHRGVLDRAAPRRVQCDLDLSTTPAGLLTALPVLCFARWVPWPPGRPV